MEIQITELSLTERVTLLGIAGAVVAGDAPLDSHEARHVVTDHLEDVDATVVGQLDEGDVIRALNSLGTEPYVTETQSSTSPTGKGRPRYSIKADADEVLDALAEDDRLRNLVEQVR